METPNRLNMTSCLSMQSLNMLFVRAVRNNDPKKIQQLVHRGVDVNHSQQKNGRTMLFYATEYNAVECLLKLGADPNQEAYDGQTALDYAIISRQFGRHVIINELLEYDAKMGERGLSLTSYFAKGHMIFRRCPTPQALGADPLWPTNLLKHVLVKEVHKPNLERFLKIFSSTCNTNKMNAHLGHAIHLCQEEIQRMKEHIVMKDITMYDIVSSKRDFGPVLKRSRVYNLCLDNFVIYKKIAQNAIKRQYELGNMIEDLENIYCFTISDDGTKTTLNTDTVRHVAQFLSWKDLKNFIIAFHVNPEKRKKIKSNTFRVFNYLDKKIPRTTRCHIPQFY